MNKLRKSPSGFTMVPNALIRSNTLSLKAKGLYCLLFSKPDNWIYLEDALVKESADGRESYRSGIKELVETGWLAKVQVRDENGVFSHVDWHLSDDGSSVAGKPVAGESPANNTEDNKTKRSKTDTPIAPKGAEAVNGAFEDFWKAYPNKVGKPVALRAFLKAEKLTGAKFIADGVERWKQSEEWQKEKGKYIPHPSTFLNRLQFNDTPRSMAVPKTELEQRNADFMSSFIGQPTNQKQIA